MYMDPFTMLLFISVNQLSMSVLNLFVIHTRFIH